MRINALCTAKFAEARRNCDGMIAVSGEKLAGDGITTIEEFDGTARGDIYLPSMLDFDLLEKACDAIFDNGVRAVVRASYSLEETGIIEARCKLSPVMFLHKLGILGMCTIASGVCLDNDDLDLMAQENVPLVLLPTADAGYGNGFAPVCAAVRRGVRVGIGTFDGKYNRSASPDAELRFLTLIANAEMHAENALGDDEAKRILAFEK